ncbi:Gfo/Idh/MocA family oxidoreductase [Streptomyces sp. MST-110588]|uniref:Gfo/Idh/MocA family protein n=1 Tax=Streptomyces sp. MST-110588 TaxID=2833628 RepID=UPI001F5C934F|nr:Gfo/Idh/MocA family oxidoreductase [Streptomyces sp. MST-110588]UNO40761.1 Gfo/Idh/MocA family oxidoreductase [Streptomyces sp. MST-110588]
MSGPVPHIARRAASPSPDVALRFAVLGAADIAWRRMLPAMEAFAGTEIAVVASRSPQRAARFAERFGADTAPDYETALARPGVDAVYIPLPNALHAPWAERALAAGKHVLVEKPLATDAATVVRLQELARRRGLVLRESMMFAHHRRHAEVRRLVAEGAVGTPLSFSAAFTVPARPQGDIRLDPGLGGGALLDAAVYPVRAALLHLGHGLEVAGAVLRHENGTDTGGSALLVSPQGVTAQLEWGFGRPYRCHYEIVGTDGELRAERAFTPPPDHRPVLRHTRNGRTEESETAPHDQFQAVLAAFRAEVAGTVRGDADRAASLAQARLIDHIRQDARAHKA